MNAHPDNRPLTLFVFVCMCASLAFLAGRIVGMYA